MYQIKYSILLLVKPLKIALLATLLGGCGFQLQGTDVRELESVSLSGSAAGQTRKMLVRSLQNYGVKIVSAGPGIIDINLIDSHPSRRPVSTSARFDTAQYELRLDLIIRVTLDSKPINNDISFHADRIYSVDSFNLSGSFEEQQILMSEMGNEVADMIIRRLESWLYSGRIGES